MPATLMCFGVEGFYYKVHESELGAPDDEITHGVWYEWMENPLQFGGNEDGTQ